MRDKLIFAVLLVAAVKAGTVTVRRGEGRWSTTIEESGPTDDFDTRTFEWIIGGHYFEFVYGRWA